MKILITYYSDTGNTEKVAKSIKEGIVGHYVDFLPVKQVDPLSLESYDLVFLGSGIYAYAINRRITSLIKKAPKLPHRFVYFYTHESQNPWPNAFKSIRNIIGQNNCKIIGEFECRGENLKMTEKSRQNAMKNLAAGEKKEWEKQYNLVKGRPNEEDLDNAKKFAQSIMQKL
jgi:flavodoxin I